MNHRHWPWALLLAAAGAQAQDDGLRVSVGARVWVAQWTTFSYTGGNPNNIIQSPAETSTVLMPVVSLRWRDWVASASWMPEKTVRFADGDSGNRSERDVNVGYTVMPGLTLTAGWKRIEQSNANKTVRYTPRGLVLGASATAPLSGELALYGSLGFGNFNTPAGIPGQVEFKSSYRVTEVGLAHGWATNGWPRRWVATAGYRTQVLNSRDALPGKNGLDTTQGFTVGVLAQF